MAMRLGRVMHHDPASRGFPAAKAETIHNVAHRRYGSVLNQGNVGACTCFALSHAVNTAPLHHNGRLLHNTDGLTLYRRATLLDNIPGNYPPEDTGSTGLAACKAGVEAGYLKEYRHLFGYDQFLAGLMLSPVMFGSNWYSGMFYPNASGLVEVSGSLAGGHEYLCVGYAVKTRMFRFLNSWTNVWGVRGYFYMAEATVRRLLSEDGDCIVPVSV